MEENDPHTTLAEYFSSIQLGNVGGCLSLSMVSHATEEKQEGRGVHCICRWTLLFFQFLVVSRLFDCTYIIFLMIYGPLFIEAAAVTLVLAIFIPLGFFIGLIEHRYDIHRPFPPILYSPLSLSSPHAPYILAYIPFSFFLEGLYSCGPSSCCSSKREECSIFSLTFASWLNSSSSPLMMSLR